MNLKDDLLYINDNKVVPSAYILTIKEFKDLSINELSFVYCMSDHRSPFAVYEWEQRIIEAKKSIFGEKNKFKPSTKILNGKIRKIL